MSESFDFFRKDLLNGTKEQQKRLQALSDLIDANILSNDSLFGGKEIFAGEESLNVSIFDNPSDPTLKKLKDNGVLDSLITFINADGNDTLSAEEQKMFKKMDENQFDDLKLGSYTDSLMLINDFLNDDELMAKIHQMKTEAQATVGVGEGGDAVDGAPAADGTPGTEITAGGDGVGGAPTEGVQPVPDAESGQNANVVVIEGLDHEYKPANDKVTVTQYSDEAVNENNCLSRIIKNNYGKDIKYDSQEYWTIANAIIAANPDIYASGRKLVGGNKIDSTLLRTGETVNLPTLTPAVVEQPKELNPANPAPTVTENPDAKTAEQPKDIYPNLPEGAKLSDVTDSNTGIRTIILGDAEDGYKSEGGRIIIRPDGTATVIHGNDGNMTVTEFQGYVQGEGDNLGTGRMTSQKEYDNQPYTSDLDKLNKLESSKDISIIYDDNGVKIRSVQIDRDGITNPDGTSKDGVTIRTYTRQGEAGVEYRFSLDYDYDAKTFTEDGLTDNPNLQGYTTKGADGNPQKNVEFTRNGDDIFATTQVFKFEDSGTPNRPTSTETFFQKFDKATNKWVVVNESDIPKDTAPDIQAVYGGIDGEQTGTTETTVDDNGVTTTISRDADGSENGRIVINPDGSAVRIFGNDGVVTVTKYEKYDPNNVANSKMTEQNEYNQPYSTNPDQMRSDNLKSSFKILYDEATGEQIGSEKIEIAEDGSANIKRAKSDGSYAEYNLSPYDASVDFDANTILTNPNLQNYKIVDAAGNTTSESVITKNENGRFMTTKTDGKEYVYKFNEELQKWEPFTETPVEDSGVGNQPPVNPDLLSNFEAKNLATKLNDAMAIVGTDEEAVNDIILNGNYTDAQLVQIMDTYQKEFNKSLMDSIQGDFSGDEENALRTKIFEALKSEANKALTPKNPDDYSEAIQDYVINFDKNKFFDDVKSGKLSNEDIVQVIQLYEQVNPGTDAIKAITDKVYWLGDEDNVIRKIYDAHLAVIPDSIPQGNTPPTAGSGTEVPPAAGPGTEVPPAAGPGTQVPPAAGPGTEVPPAAGPGTQVPPAADAGTEVPVEDASAVQEFAKGADSAASVADHIRLMVDYSNTNAYDKTESYHKQLSLMQEQLKDASPEFIQGVISKLSAEQYQNLFKIFETGDGWWSNIGDDHKELVQQLLTPDLRYPENMDKLLEMYENNPASTYGKEQYYNNFIQLAYETENLHALPKEQAEMVAKFIGKGYDDVANHAGMDPVIAKFLMVPEDDTSGKTESLLTNIENTNKLIGHLPENYQWSVQDRTSYYTNEIAGSFKKADFLELIKSQGSPENATTFLIEKLHLGDISELTNHYEFFVAIDEFNKG